MLVDVRFRFTEVSNEYDGAYNKFSLTAHNPRYDGYVLTCEIPEIAAAEAPDAVVFPGPGYHIVLKRYRRTLLRQYAEGRGPFYVSCDNPPSMIGEAFSENVGRSFSVDLRVVSEHRRGHLVLAPEPPFAGNRLAAFRNLVDDAVNKVTEVAEGICLIDGRVWGPCPDPVWVVYPPGEYCSVDFSSPFNRKTGTNKAARCVVELMGLADPDVRFAVADDRVFNMDEYTLAVDRRASFNSSVYRSQKVVCDNLSALDTDISTAAVRLTAAGLISSAIYQSPPGTKHRDFKASVTRLRAVLKDRDTNAASVIPGLRSLIAAFAASPELTALSTSRDVAKSIAQAEAAIVRAGKRMDVGKTPSYDPRFMAPADNDALSRLA